MRRYIRYAVWISAAGLLLAVVIGSIAAIAVWRQTTITAAPAREAEIAFEQIRTRFPARLPLVQIVDPGPIMMDIRVHRPPESAARHALQYFHVLAWDGTGRLVQSRVPFWWMHLSGDSLMARLGVPLGAVSLTADDVQRYGPGVVVDFPPPGGGRVLVWVQ